MHRPSIVLFGAVTFVAVGGFGRAPSTPRLTAVHGDATSQPGVARQGLSARDLLAKVRGVDPVVCQLVGEALHERWGGGSVSPILRLPERSETSMELVRWARRAHDEPEMIPHLRAALNDPDSCVRQTAARLFAHVRDRVNAVRALRDAIRSSWPETQRAAVLALGYLEDSGTLTLLTQQLSSRDPTLRQVGAWALGRLEHADAVPVLLQALDDQDVGVRGNAAWALGQIERPAAVMPLTSALGDAEVSVRLNAMLALGNIEDARAIPALTELLGQDRSAEVRRAAAWALGRIE